MIPANAGVVIYLQGGHSSSLMPETAIKTERVFLGTPVSGGVARGVVRLIGGAFEEPHRRVIPKGKIDAEIECFYAAVEATREELEALMARLDGEEDRHSREILEMHTMVLNDSLITDQVEEAIREYRECAEYAYYRVVRKCIDSFQRIPDSYMRERALDIRDVAQRVLRHLTGDKREVDHSDTPAVCIAHDLTPSETAQLDRNQVLGFAVELGSKTSHTAIVARSLNLPAVVRLHGICEELYNGDEVLLDGDEGLLILNPTKETLARYRKREAAAEKREAALLAQCGEPAVTLDDRRITVAANAEFVEEIPHIQECGAEGVGLFRTEFLYLENPDAPEDKLIEVYTEVVKAMAPQLVVFRTLDLGGDKLDPAYAEEVEQNPFLGWRGIRVSLARPEVFKRQLRAILKASQHGRVAIMYPMVSSVREVVEANQLLDECQAELTAAGEAFDPKIQRGAMIEIPSAAVIADLLAPHVDFFSIGTNDLVQYTLAVDRVNERVSELYQPTHPAVLRLIKTVVEAAHRQNVWVGMCGEMAGDIAVTPLLVGLGLDELSASSGQVAKVKHAIRKLNSVDCVELLERSLKESDALKIQHETQKFARKHYGDLMPETH
jgi:phosphotransferase system enzyme I (PtsI)